jgi:hypothetical protein
LKLKYAVKIAALKAVYTQLGTTAKSSVSATASIFQAQRLKANVQTLNRILSDAEEGNFIYFAKYFDTFYVNDGTRPSDQMVFELFRYLADDSYTADLYIAQFNKIVGDGVGISDTDEFIKNFNRPLAEAPAALDSFVSHFSRPVADAFFAADDAAALHPNKVVSEVTYLSDGIDTFAVGKPLEDIPVFLEAHRYDFGKPVSDAYSISEAHSLEPGKVLQDTVSGIGDYAFIFTKKAPGDTLGATDQITTVTFGKPLTDSSAAADAIDTFAFSKALYDTPLLSDEITSFATTKQLYDSVFATDDVDGTATILDDQEMQFVKQRTDVAFIGDSIYLQRGYIRDFFEDAAAADAALFSLGKTLSDVSSTSDTTNVVTGKQNYDIPVATETLSLAFTSPRTDSALIGDANEVAFNKTLQELASTADAGSLRSQGYSDFTYFGEDFVGASRTF